MKEPRIGIWLCDCCGLLAKGLDMEALEEACRKLPHGDRVVRASRLCGKEDLQALRADLEAGGMDRLLFVGCSARSSLRFPEERLRAVLMEAGMDWAMVEVANIREQGIWQHPQREAATARAIDQVRMAHALLSSHEPRQAPVFIQRKSLVIGGGPAGLQAAKDLSASGCPVLLVEQGGYLGGRLCQTRFLFQSEAWPSFCVSECLGPVQASWVLGDPLIEVLTQSQVRSIARDKGNFTVEIEEGARYVDGERCISCGECAKACPETLFHPFGAGIVRRRAIDKDFERAVPDCFSLVREACTLCGACLEVCPTKAINLEARPSTRVEQVGAVFVATGLDTGGRAENRDLGFMAPNVVTSVQLERMMASGHGRPSDGKVPESVVFIQCAGSRASEERTAQGVEYCSKTCCSITAKQAERLGMALPETEITVICYRDMRTYERALEALYVKAKDMGIAFVRGDVTRIDPLEEGNLAVTMTPFDEEARGVGEEEGEAMRLEADLVVLAEAQVPRRQQYPLMEGLGLTLDRHGFPMEAQPRAFTPTETLVDRVYAIGSSSGPKVVQHCSEQASAAVARALPLLRAGRKEQGKFISAIEPKSCSRCGLCVALCPHGAITMTDEGAVVAPAFCQECGTCAAACPSRAPALTNFTARQILDQVDVAFGELAPGEPRLLALLCYWCSYSGADMAGIKRLEVLPNHRTIRIRCSSSVDLGLILAMFQRGVDGVLVAGCPPKNCHHAWGNYTADRKITLARRALAQLGVSEVRMRYAYLGVPNAVQFQETIATMDRELRALGPNPLGLVRQRSTEA